MTVEKLREEANAMERLVHRHILKLVGTYTLKKNHLYFMLYPAAVCDLNRFLKDIDDIQLDNVADQDDAFKRLQSLGLGAIGTIDDLPAPRNSVQATASGYLQQILGCMTEALAFVHKQDIRHGDLNPKNILLSPGRLYLADFGIARDVRESENSITGHRYGTPFWMAPEVHDELDHHRSPADIWSLGCVFLKIMTVLYGEHLERYDETMKEHDWKKKYEMLPKYLERLRSRGVSAGYHHLDAPSFCSKHIIDLIEKMLKYNPDERPTAAQVNSTLSEHGGLDQIYHLSCCHKSNSDITEIISKYPPDYYHLAGLTLF
jgi:serine/threonine protein kinase